MMSTGLNLVMTVIGFAVSTMFIVFVCTRLICARIQLRASRRAFPTASRSDLSVLERGIHGLEPVIVASFPTKKFGDQYFSSGQDIQCTVCLAEYQEKDVLRILPYCGHTFHITCIDIWLKQHSTCPVCRISLRDSPDRKRAMQPVYSAASRSYHPETVESDPCHNRLAGHGCSAWTSENQRMDSTRTDHFSSEPSGTLGTLSTLSEVDRSIKNARRHETEGKHIESPSYS
ncbi:RING-H2 finger protein ATL38-like isoform X1 [Phoenix dactylifera]|uniref:RING-type E3 ubiquitin transferase n=1 Tax=Phoenix dactylifera TaxID=42345 RepID=A0A8B7CVK4_PHODC|nr:RING-H2 finger protein ATL38-like isoform X1 [Phoenix dactylifera]